jgi:hypothetical protein
MVTTKAFGPTPAAGCQSGEANTIRCWTPHSDWADLLIQIRTSAQLHMMTFMNWSTF